VKSGAEENRTADTEVTQKFPISSNECQQLPEDFEIVEPDCRALIMVQCHVNPGWHPSGKYQGEIAVVVKASHSPVHDSLSAASRRKLDPPELRSTFIPKERPTRPQGLTVAAKLGLDQPHGFVL
jgi:hypothetical protein